MTGTKLDWNLQPPHHVLFPLSPRSCTRSLEINRNSWWSLTVGLGCWNPSYAFKTTAQTCWLALPALMFEPTLRAHWQYVPVAEKGSTRGSLFCNYKWEENRKTSRLPGRPKMMIALMSSFLFLAKYFPLILQKDHKMFNVTGISNTGFFNNLTWPSS